MPAKKDRSAFGKYWNPYLPPPRKHIRVNLDPYKVSRDDWRKQFRAAKWTLKGRLRAQADWETEVVDPYDKEMCRKRIKRLRSLDSRRKKNVLLVPIGSKCGRCKHYKHAWAYSYVRWCNTQRMLLGTPKQTLTRDETMSLPCCLCTSCHRINVKHKALSHLSYMRWSDVVRESLGAQGFKLNPDVLRQARERIGVSQADFATHAGYTTAYQARLETSYGMRITQDCGRRIEAAIDLLTKT